MNNLLSYFEHIDDPRVERTKLHSLQDIIGICICAVIGGADGWDAIHDFGIIRHQWLKKFLSLDHGIPSPDTIRRVISKIDATEFQSGFGRWIKDVVGQVEGIVSIDGKTVRNKASSNPIHLVSAWASMNNGICLGQVSTSAKSNEITAIPNLLDILDIKGCIVTIDAMGCQKSIAKAIVEEKEADFCLAVKKNHKNLFSDLVDFFADCDGEIVEGARKKTTGGNEHGRTEKRTAYVSHDIGSFDTLEDWPEVKCIGMVLSERSVKGICSVERRYFISSARLSATQLLTTVRSHWGIENSLHWVLDVTFKEDGNRVLKDNGPENLASLRKVAISLLKAEKTKLSIKRKMFRSGMDPQYMEQVLNH